MYIYINLIYIVEDRFVSLNCSVLISVLCIYNLKFSTGHSCYEIPF